MSAEPVISTLAPSDARGVAPHGASPPVVNLAREKDATGLYIGRAFAGREASPWANPFPVGTDTPERRREVVWQCVLALMDSDQRLKLADLKDQALLCWCAPSLCHGHALRFLASRLELHGTACPDCGSPVRSVLNLYRWDFRGLPDQFMLYESTICPTEPIVGKTLPHRRYLGRGEISITLIEEHASMAG